MRMITRSMKWITRPALAYVVGSLPSCATMGGGAMKYLVDPQSSSWERVQL